MTTKLFNRALLAALAVATLSLGHAEARTMRTCPGGIQVPDYQRCPDKWKGRFPPPPQSQAQAPKPKDPTKDWRDYTLGNPKPPINPKK